MACKNSIPTRKCGDCHYINHDAYRGTGKKVCYELQRDSNNRKVAVEVTENQKACGSFHVAKKVGRVG